MEQAPFFLQLIDKATNCILCEVALSEADVDALCAMLEVGRSDIASFQSIDQEKIEQIINIDEYKYNKEALILRTRKRYLHDSLPYTIHTGRELKLMLQGIKPLSVFSHEIGHAL